MRRGRRPAHKSRHSSSERQPSLSPDEIEFGNIPDRSTPNVLKPAIEQHPVSPGRLAY